VSTDHEKTKMVDAKAITIAMENEEIDRERK